MVVGHDRWKGSINVRNTFGDTGLLGIAAGPGVFEFCGYGSGVVASNVELLGPSQENVA